MTKRPRRTFTKEFKEQIVQLYLSGKPINIMYENQLFPATICWAELIK